MDLFPRSDIFMFFAQWVLCPCVLKTLIYKGFQRTQSFFFVINATVSTWLELIELMSEGDFWHHLYVGTYQWVFGCFPRNRRSREHINRYRAGFFAKARVEIKIIICQPFCMFKLYASNSFFTSIHNLCDELPLGKYPINSFTKIVTN